MSSLSILDATIRHGEKIEHIDLEHMTKDLFYKVQDNLYCPNPECNARIEYASGPKRTFFRTKRSIVNGEEIQDQHISSCPYFVEHDKNLRNRAKYAPDLYSSISEKHMKQSLVRAHKKYVDPEYGKKGEISNAKRKSKSTQSKQDKNLLRGKATLVVTANEVDKKEREASIFKRDINDITEIDYGQARIVIGEFEEFVIKDDYKYIKLKLKDNRKGRIYFGERFRVENRTQYEQIDNYKLYFEWKKGKTIIISCFGEITKDDFDISVVMNSYKGILIDLKSHYEMLSFLNR